MYFDFHILSVKMLESSIMTGYGNFHMMLGHGNFHIMSGGIWKSTDNAVIRDGIQLCWDMWNITQCWDM
jgi:hypothetical protein